MIRNSVRFVAWADRKSVVNALKPIYSADTEAAAEAALTAFERGLGLDPLPVEARVAEGGG